MPIFTFQCFECGERIEKLQGYLDKTPSCPACGKPTNRVWSTPSPAQWRCSKGSL